MSSPNRRPFMAILAVFGAAALVIPSIATGPGADAPTWTFPAAPAPLGGAAPQIATANNFPTNLVDGDGDWAELSDPEDGPADGSGNAGSIPIPTAFLLNTRGAYPWQIVAGGVIGYADKPSYLPGETMNFAISSGAN